MAKKEVKRPDEAAMLRVLKNNEGFIVECILRLAWTMGFFTNEMLSIKWSDVSFETGEIILPNRRVPMDEEMQICLQKRRKRRAGQSCEFVVASDRTCKQMNRVSVGRAARVAMDAEESLRNVTLVDLREDCVIRLLEQHDLAYVAKVSGIKAATLMSASSPYYEYTKGGRLRGRSSKQVEEIEDYEYKLWVLTQNEALSPEGLAIWMIWQLGMMLEDVVALTWEQVDFERKMIRVADKYLPMGAVLERRLRQLRESQSLEVDPHVLLTPRSRRAFKADRLSRVVGAVLIQNGLGEVDLRKLGRLKEQQSKDDLLMLCAKGKGYITAVEAAELLQTSLAPARNQLKKLEQSGLLTPVGFRYYLADTVVPEEKQEEIITRYIKENGGTRRKELADILGIVEKQCTWLLDTFVKKGTLLRIGFRYYLSEDVPQGDERYEKIRAYLEEKGTATPQELAVLLNIKKGSVKDATKELVASGKLVLDGAKYCLPEQ